MTDKVFLNASRSAVVSEFDPGGKKWVVDRDEAVRLGLIADKDAKPQARRTEAFDASKATAPVEPKKKPAARRKRK